MMNEIRKNSHFKFEKFATSVSSFKFEKLF
jgi:hypothetical protein